MRLLLSLLLSFSLAGAAIAQTPAKPAKAARPPAAASAPAAADFQIGPRPAWVNEITPDAGAPVASAPVQVLLMDHQTRVEKTGSVRYWHAVRAVTSTAGLQSASQITVDFDPSYQRVVMHQLLIWRDGKRIDKLQRKAIKVLHRETNLERQMVDGRMTLSIVLDDLRVGDRIDWSASTIGDNPVFEGRFVDTEWTSASLGPMAQVYLRLLSPADRTIHHREPKDLVTVQETEDKGWHDLVIRRNNVPQFHFDPTVPYADASADQVEYSEFADWADVARWAQRLFANTGGGAALAAKAAEIRAQAATPEERLERALDFVQQDIRYFGTEVGANSHRPASADAVLHQRFGDCKDKAALLMNLLAELDIKATPALVSTYLRDTVGQRLPSPLNFDHAIAAVQQGDKLLWLDGTRNQQHGTPQSRESEGLGLALLARTDETQLTAMPKAADQLRMATEDRFVFSPLKDEGHLTSTTTYYGSVAEGLRQGRAEVPAADFEKYVTAIQLRAYPGFVQEGPLQVEEVAGSNALRITLKLRTGDYWRLVEGRLMVGDWVLYHLVEALRLPDQNPRTQALRIGLPGRYTQRVEFVSDDALYASDSSSQFKETNPFFKLEIGYKSTVHRAEINADLQMSAERVEAAQWTNYRDDLKKIWPRMGAVMAVTAVAPTRLDAFKKSLADLDASVKASRIKVLTRAQVQARARLALTDQMLAEPRLPPKLMAQVMVNRGMDLDHIGEGAAGRLAFEQAIQLNPELADAHAGLAVNALLTGHDQDAIADAEKALALKADDVASQYTKAYALHMAGDNAAARSELLNILQSSSEVDRSYGAIWLYLSTRTLGDDGVKATDAVLPSGSEPAWPFAALRYLRGDIAFKAALAAADSDAQSRRERECELYYYAGKKALLDKNPAEARKDFQLSVDTGVTEFLEYGLAKRELGKLN
jgi:lipoprotein NlpI/transglutaminase-like putative cysteine protease